MDLFLEFYSTYDKIVLGIMGSAGAAMILAAVVYWFFLDKDIW